MRPRSICTISPWDKKSGIYTYSNNLSDLLGKAGKNMIFSEAHFDYQHVGFFQSRQRLFFQSIQKLRQYDVLHFHYDSAGYYRYGGGVRIVFEHVLLCLYIRLINRPVVITLHSFFDDALRYRHILKLMYWIFFRALLFRSKIIFVSHSQEYVDRLKNLFPLYADRFVYIPHLVYPLLIRSGSNKSLKGKKKVLVTLGFIAPWKGQLDLVEIVNKLRLRRTNFIYYILGSARYYRDYYLECRSLIKKYRLEKFIILRNVYLSPKLFATYLHKADLYLDFHTRKDHISSGTLMHAVASGVPVLTTSIPLTRDKDIASQVTISSDKQEYLQHLTACMDTSQKRSSFDYKKINLYARDKYIALYERVLE